MAFCMEASGGTSGVRRRMKNALGRWSAQYQQEAPVALFCEVMDPPESVLPNGAQSAPGLVTESEPQSAAAPEAAPTPEAAPQTEPFISNGTRNGTGTAGAPKDEASPHGPRPEEQQEEQERGQAYERFEPKPPSIADYYEVLQISRNADPETIHRVYRIMVARFHPDNPRTGDPERFRLLRRAYHVLSDPGSPRAVSSPV